MPIFFLKKDRSKSFLHWKSLQIMQETRNNRKILAQPFVRAKIDKNDYHKIAAMYSPEFIIFFSKCQFLVLLVVLNKLFITFLLNIIKQQFLVLLVALNKLFIAFLSVIIRYANLQGELSVVIKKIFSSFGCLFVVR